MKIFLLALAFCVAAFSVQAVELADIENYLNNIKTLEADFRQITPEQNLVTYGDFYWQRPGQFRWRYTPPEGPELIGNTNGWFFNDPHGTVTQLPRGAGWAGFLTQNTFDFNAPDLPFQVASVARVEGGVELTLAPRETQETTPLGVQKLTLGFSVEPVALRRLITVDELGQRTAVLFEGVQINTPLPNNIFDFTPSHYDTLLND